LIKFQTFTDLEKFVVALPLRIGSLLEVGGGGGSSNGGLSIF
jgi:hypothetical protein